MPGPVHEIAFEVAVGQWHFRRADPTQLAGIVEEYWAVEGTLAPFRETVLPNGRLELMINLGPPHRVFSDQGKRVWKTAWISGLQEHSIGIESKEGTHLVSARLHPAGAMEVMGAYAPQAANRIVDLEDTFGSAAADLRDAALAATSTAERFDLIERFLQERREPSNAAPAFVRDAARRIEDSHGNLRVSELHEETGVSRKHLATTFRRVVGLSMKAYGKVQRFAWTLARLRASSTVDWSKLASEAGYSDQSHLVRDFRRVGAASPTEYLQRLTPDGTALWENADDAR